MKKIKFMWNGIKVDGKLYKAHYSNSKLINYPEGTITIYAKNYSGLPDGIFSVENNTDIMTDYFEKDKARVLPTDKIYKEVYAAMEKYELHFSKIWDKKINKQ